MSRPQQRIKRVVYRGTFADNSRLVVDLPRDFDYESVIIRISGTVTNTVAFAAVRAEAPLQLVKFASLKANGTDLLDGLPGPQAHRLGIMRRGQLPPVTPPSGFGVAAYAFAGVFCLDRSVIDGVRPKDGAFKSVGLSTFQLELQMGAAADIYTGAGTGTITSGVITVVAVQLSEEADASGKITMPRVVTKRTHSDIPFAASNANYQHRLNTGNAMRGLLLRGYGVTAGEPSDAVINNVKLVRGNEVLIDLPYNELRAMNAMDYDVTTIPTGYCLIDFMTMGGPSGKLSDCLDLRKGEEVFLVLDVTGGANVAVGVTTLEYMAYNPKYWGINIGA